MIRSKKESRRIFFVLLFLFIIFIPNVFIFANNNNYQEINSINNLESEEYNKDPINSNLNYPITGTGDNQEVRIYVNNESENNNNNQNYFNISTNPSQEMYLNYGAFDFTFQNNHTANYTIEDDDALYTTNSIYNFDTNNISSNVEFTNGTISSGEFANFTDNDPQSYIVVNATNGFINFTVRANFTDMLCPIPSGDVKFNRSHILGLSLSMVYNLTDDANLTVRIKDNTPSTWKELISAVEIDSSSGVQDVRELLTGSKKIINENLNFTGTNNCTYIQFIFNRTNGELNATLYDFNLEATHAFDLPITNTSYVALEFDLKGLNSTVNGFYAWVRTLNVSEAANTHLNITLYRANDTAVRTDANYILNSANLGPDYNSPPIDTMLKDYTNDNLTYFAFDTSKTSGLNVSNYFIVIKSNNSKEVYSLVTLPNHWYYGDDENEHLLKTTEDKGVSWEFEQLDASSFKLNVIRGYMPSDFIGNETDKLKIRDIPIDKLEIKSFPYNKSSFLTWGKGQWNYNFTTPIEDTPENFFKINLTWNKSIISGFKFNVSYSIKAFWKENASVTYSVVYDEDPKWFLNYTLEKGDQKFDNWSLIELWMIFPNYMTAYSLTKLNPPEIPISQIGKQSIFNEAPSYHKIIINDTIANLNGSYTLNLNSFNFIQNMESYIERGGGNLWETRGFMLGDSITASVNIQDQKFKAPNNGNATVRLFYGADFFGEEINNFASGIIDKSTLKFDFDNQSIISLPNTVTTFGNYYLGFFWFNGSAIGCKKIMITIDAYDLDLYGCNYNSNRNRNILDGEIKNKVMENYTILVASVNETTGISRDDFYPINNTEVNEEFNVVVGSQTLPVLLKSFKQSENVINPGEDVIVNATIQNLHAFVDSNVKINVKLVSLANEEWIIAQDPSESVQLNYFGSTGDTYEFSVNVGIPNWPINQFWYGANAPIRLAGAKTIITVFIENTNAGDYESSEYSILSNKTNDLFEGHILKLKMTENLSSMSILYEFLREECVYLPNTTSFMVNIFDDNYISSYTSFQNEFSLQLSSQFTNVTINPENPIKGQSFNVSAILSTEFGERLINKNVSYEYYYNSSWFKLGSDYTDSNGLTKLLIDNYNLDFEGDLTLRLKWEGNNISGTSINISVPLFDDSSRISMSLIKDEVTIYKNKETTFTITLYNAGDSNLRITNISIELNYNFEYSIVEKNEIFQSWLSPGDRTHIILRVEIGDITKLEINVTITFQNIITNDTTTISNGLTIDIFTPPVTDTLIDFFPLIMVCIFALIVITTIIYSKKITKRLETPIEEPVKKRPRRGRYVPVSELKKQLPAKQIQKKQEVPTKEKKKVDLDSLLEEKGLDDTKKKKLKKQLPPKQIQKKQETPTKEKKLKKTKEKKLKKTKKKKMKKQLPVKQIQKKQETPTKEKKTIDLDSLLEEKGLDDTKKKKLKK